MNTVTKARAKFRDRISSPMRKHTGNSLWGCIPTSSLHENHEKNRTPNTRKTSVFMYHWKTDLGNLFYRSWCTFSIVIVYLLGGSRSNQKLCWDHLWLLFTAEQQADVTCWLYWLALSRPVIQTPSCSKTSQQSLTVLPVGTL